MLKLSSCFAYHCIIIYFVASLCAVIIKYGQQIMAWSLENTSQHSLKVIALGQSRWLWLSNLLQVTRMRNSPPPIRTYEADRVCILVLGWGRWRGRVRERFCLKRTVRWGLWDCSPGKSIYCDLTQSWGHVHGERSKPTPGVILTSHTCTVTQA